MAEKVLKIKSVSEVAEAISGLTSLEGSLKGVGTAAIQAAGKSKAQWVELEAEWQKANPTLKGLAASAFEVESALNKMGSAKSTAQLESGLVAAQAKLNAFRAKLDEVRAAGGTIDEGMRSSLAVMESSIQAGVDKLVAMKSATEEARTQIAEMGKAAEKAAEAAKRAAGGAQQFGAEWRKSAYEAGNAARQAAGDAAKLRSSTDGAANSAVKLKDQTTGVAKSVMAASGAVGPYGELLEKLGNSGSNAAGKFGTLAFKVVAVAGALKVGWDAGTKVNEFLQQHGNYLEKAIDWSVKFATATGDTGKRIKGLAADIDLENKALTEHTKALAANVVQRAASRKATEAADRGIKDAVEGWKSAAQQQKELDKSISEVARKFKDLQKNGADWRKEVEANKGPLEQWVASIEAGGRKVDELDPILQEMIEYLRSLGPAATTAQSSLARFWQSVDGWVKSGQTGKEAIESIAAGLKGVKDAGEMTPEFLDQARSALEGLADGARSSYETWDIYRKEILDTIPAYEATELANRGLSDAVDELTQKYREQEASRRAQNEDDLARAVALERERDAALQLAYAVDSIGDAWARATGQAAGFTVEVRRAREEVETADPTWTAFIDQLAEVSDGYERMVPWIGAMLAEVESGDLSLEDFLKKLGEIRAGFIQIQGMSGHMFGDLETEINQLTKIINDFLGENRFSRDPTKRPKGPKGRK